MRLIALLMLYLLIGCNVPSRNTVSFSYIEINEMKLSSGNSNFTDAWVFLNGVSYGVFELPRIIPFVSEEPIEGVIQAGIRENGISSSPRVYPFVDNYQIDLDLAAGDVLALTPLFSYVPSAKIRLSATFDGQKVFGYNEDGNDSIMITNTSEGYGLINLLAGEVLEEATTLVYNELPKDGSPIYLEIEYRGNADLDVGLIGISGGEVFKDYFVSLRSENEWKMTYINLTDLVIASNLNGYQVLLGVDNSGSNSEAKVFVDNIKLLHF